jgi:DNA/RNA-binding domain of Phe-tRNA-synthetase-like protein
MKFTVDEQIFEMFPRLHIGVLVVSGMNNRGTQKELWDMMEERQRHVRREFTSNTLSQHPRIAAWRNAYSAFGAKPKKYKSSVESLYRMALKGVKIRPINTIVDVYNCISLKHMVPAGGDDMSRVEGNIRLTLASGNETFRPLNSAETEVVKPGEVVYRDSVEVLCRRWNWRECDKTKMTEATRNVILVVEGLPPVSREEMQNILMDLHYLVAKYCGGTMQNAILNATHREIDLSSS